MCVWVSGVANCISECTKKNMTSLEKRIISKQGKHETDMYVNCNTLCIECQSKPHDRAERASRLRAYAKSLPERDQYMLAALPFLLLAMRAEEEEEEELRIQQLCWWSPCANSSI